MDETLQRFLQASTVGLWENLTNTTVAQPATVSAIDIDSDWILSEWHREIFERLLIQARGGSVRFVESEHGGGRSHFLQLVLAKARSAGLATVELPTDQQSIYWRDPLALYQAIAERLRGGRHTASVGLLAMVSATARLGIARSELFPEYPKWGLALELYAKSGSLEAERFLMGLDLKGDQPEVLGLHASISSRQALPALRCLLQFLEYAEESGLVVVSDGDGWVDPDLERSTLESLRSLIDTSAAGHLPGILIACGVLPEFRRQMLPEYEALQQRLHSGFALGPAGCLRPILVLEAQRLWRRTQGVRFVEDLAYRIYQLALNVYPELGASSSLVRRNLGGLLRHLEEDDWDQNTPREIVRLVSRWLSDPSTSLMNLSPEDGDELVDRFLREQSSTYGH